MGLYCQEQWLVSNARNIGGSLMPGTVLGLYCQERWWVYNASVGSLMLGKKIYCQEKVLGVSCQEE